MDDSSTLPRGTSCDGAPDAKSDNRALLDRHLRLRETYTGNPTARYAWELPSARQLVALHAAATSAEVSLERTSIDLGNCHVETATRHYARWLLKRIEAGDGTPLAPSRDVTAYVRTIVAAEVARILPELLEELDRKARGGCA